MNFVIQLLTIPAGSAYFYNDVLGIISISGSIILILAEFRNSPFKRLVGLAERYSAPLVFGSFFQFAFIITGLVPETERMGIVLPMPPISVTMLFVLSYLLLGARLWMRRNPSIHV